MNQIFLQTFEEAFDTMRAKVEKQTWFDRIYKVKMNVPMLVQASQVYTPIIFESSQAEFERSITACTNRMDVGYEYNW